MIWRSTADSTSPIPVTKNPEVRKVVSLDDNIPSCALSMLEIVLSFAIVLVYVDPPRQRPT